LNWKTWCRGGDHCKKQITQRVRVGREVRIFPTPHVAPVITLLQQHYRTEIVTVTHEFQRGGTQMLRIFNVEEKIHVFEHSDAIY